MNYREFGKTGMKVSEVSFGAWGIGGDYGQIDLDLCLATLARAEELGCNFIDTATVYGNSEEVIGKFLPGRRDKWLVATKWSGQECGIVALAEKQLKTMNIDVIDFYQIHWAPLANEHELYDGLYELKKSGKARFIGVSLGSAEDIEYVIKNTEIDGFQVKLSVLDPEPIVSCADMIRESGMGVIIRSCLRDGFLTGKFNYDTKFTDKRDRRGRRTEEQIKKDVDEAEQFRFLEKNNGSMMVGAARYTLSFPETSTLILGTKSPQQAEMNFDEVPAAPLCDADLIKIKEIQATL